ncbi:MAG TPA: Hsp70 family protein [Pyrinomonadaceae bacterium]|jgi:actin-like ATPase involved in cell morphogenesis|nr:Hsp70 family protein [Pyrinomonadaceae bacterium]
MTEKIYVGIEFGDVQLRIAYMVNSETLDLPLPLEVSGPQILFEQNAESSSIGVGFPAVWQKLGTPVSFTHIALKMGPELGASKVEQSIESAESMITQTLATIKQNILKVTDKPIGGAVIAVPGMMRQNSRKALLDCARDAGFDEVSLIDRCTAAALGYHSNYTDKSTTAVVCDLGYGNCEYALLRLAGERCRVMSSGTVPEVSGEALDALVIEATVLALRRKKIYLGLKHFTPFQWLEFKHIVATARNTMAEKQEAFITLIPELTGLDKAIKFRYESEPFKIKLAPLINKMVDGVHGILEQNALELADIDTILLVGNSARTSPIYDMLYEAFEQKANRTEPNLIVNGAAWHASQLAKNSGEHAEAEPDRQIGQFKESLGETTHALPLVEDDLEAQAGFAMLVDVEDDSYEQNQLRPSPALVITADVSLEIAGKFIEQGRREEASLLLDIMSQRVEALRAKLQQEEKRDVPRMLIQQALSLVASGYDLLRAVELTHRAYQQAPDDPEVFEGMLKAHVQAGLHLGSPEDYEKSIKILLCALSHDQTDRSIRQTLAERYYQHAVAMRKLNDSSKAFEIVDKALAFDAKHFGLNQLHKELAAALSNSKSVEETAESN